MGGGKPEDREFGELDAKVAVLRRASTYPGKPGRIEAVETHMSWVFLTERHAYKLKKPVCYEFLDFSTLAARHQDCLEEVRLNRRLAENVYLDVVPLTVDAQGAASVGGSGEIIDWLVRMRRLPAEHLLDWMIRHRTLREEAIRRLALVLIRFYQDSVPEKIDADLYRKRFESELQTGWQALADPVYGLPAESVAAIHQAVLDLLQREPALFAERIAAGRIGEGHGDLRPEHICLESPPVIIDCLEFNRRFRIVDRIDELAFLAMECERLGASAVGGLLLRTYSELTGDQPPLRLLHFYKAYRACLRAKLAIWHTQDVARTEWPKWIGVARDYLRVAERYALGTGFV